MKGVYQVSSFYVNISGFGGWRPPLWGIRLFNSIYDGGTLNEWCIPSFSLLRQYLRFLGLGTPPLGYAVIYLYIGTEYLKRITNTKFHPSTSISQVFGAGDPPFGVYGYLTPYMMWVPYMKGVYQVSAFYVNISGFWGWGPPLWVYGYLTPYIMWVPKMKGVY